MSAQSDQSESVLREIVERARDAGPGSTPFSGAILDQRIGRFIREYLNAAFDEDRDG